MHVRLEEWVLKKLLNKRLGLIAGCVMLSILTFTLGKNNKGDIISTMALPVTNKVIVLDAGHGGEDRRSCKW